MQLHRETQPQRTAVAEGNCRQIVQENEQFSSTVDYKWSGTNSHYDDRTESINVTVDYSAKNDLGAELPYRMTCHTDYNGNITDHNKAGR